MWCIDCRQDVPGVVSQEDSSIFHCPRCQRQVAGSRRATRPGPMVEQPTPLDTGLGTEGQPDVLDDWQFDDWQLDEDVHAIRRMIQWLRRRSTVEDPFPRVRRYESPGRMSTSLQTPHEVARPTPSSELRDEAQKRLAVAAMFYSGLSLLALGVLLLVLSYANAYAELWKLGLPLTLLGQTGLFLGLMRARTKQAARNATRDEQAAAPPAPAGTLAPRRVPDAAMLRYDSPAGPVQALAHLQRQLDQLAERIHREAR